MNELDIFSAALELAELPARDRFLEEACRGRPELRSRIDALLRNASDASRYLESPPQAILATLDRPAPEGVGTHIGPYKLLEQIGEGGMGVVYVAEQTEPVRRRVALKIIKPGMDTKQVIARFEAERQALAMMDHPNIARVLDAGTVGEIQNSERRMQKDNTSPPILNSEFCILNSASRPYFVMELVRGLPVTEYCDKARLNPRERLALFIDVCHAVQHAHQKGVIHRDLKPSNVMVTVHDGRPVAKVIDFGVAKAVGQQLTERTVYTAHTQLVGTPLYMSPEQADLSSHDVDTRSDVYSLGVLLYELLTGQTPFDKEALTKAGFDEMRRIIREDEPETVSARIARTRGTERGARNSERGTGNEQLAPRSPLRAPRWNELDWIVMKALEKDRSRRFESAGALAADIQRYLSDEPVLACPPTTMYRFQKSARKHKPALVTAAAIALCLFLGTTVSAWQAVRATTAEAQANANEQKAVANEQKANANAAQAVEKAKEATQQRDEVKLLAEKLRQTLYAAHMNLAQNDWEAGGATRAREILAEHKPKAGETDLRGLEWHYLNRVCNVELFTLKGNVKSPWAENVAYSPDGKRIASTHWDQGVKIWDAETGRELLQIDWADGGVHSATFSPDGKRLACTGRKNIQTADGKQQVNHEVRVLDAQSGQKLLSLEGGGVAVDYVENGKRLVGFGGMVGRGGGNRPMGAITIWDSESGQKLLDLKEIGARPAISSDGKRLAFAVNNRDQDKRYFISGDVKIWDVESANEVLSFRAHSNSINSVAFSPDGERLASAAADAVAKVWNAKTGQELFTLGGHQDAVRTIVFSPDGHYLATSSDDQTVKVWDASTGHELRTLRGHDKAVWAVAFRPDGKRLASSSADGTVKVWDTLPDQNPLILKGHTDGLSRVAFSPDGKRLASASYDSTVKLWDARTGKEQRTLAGHKRRVTNIVFTPDGKRLVSASHDKTLKLWDAQTGQEIRTFEGHQHFVWSLAMHPDGKRLASASADKTVKIWNIETGEEVISIKHAQEAWYVAYSPDGKRLASAAGDRIVRVWDADTGGELLTLKGHSDDLEQVTFSPDGKRLASACDDQTVKVWDSQTGQELMTLKHVGPVWDVDFSPDGKRLASGTGKGQVKIWDAQTGQQLFTFKGFNRWIDCVKFSPDGNWLASDATGNAIILYDATPLPEKP